MITRSSIVFEDFLSSSIAPQVMPPCLGVFGHVSLKKPWVSSDPMSQEYLMGFNIAFVPKLTVKISQESHGKEYKKA